MVNMKKILGILLALCFVLSVTAASAAAADGHNGGHGPKEKPGHGNKFDGNRGHGPKHDDRHGPKFDHHEKKRHHHPAHWDNKRVCHREHRHDGVRCVYVIEKVFITEYWGFD